MTTHAYRFLDGTEIDPLKVRRMGDLWLRCGDLHVDGPVDARMGFDVFLKDNGTVRFAYTVDDILGEGAVEKETARQIRISHAGIDPMQIRARIAAKLAPSAYQMMVEDVRGFLDLSAELHGAAVEVSA